MKFLVHQCISLISLALTLFRGGSEHILFRGCAIKHIPANFLTTGDTELKFYMVIDIHKSFSKKQDQYKIDPGSQIYHSNRKMIFSKK